MPPQLRPATLADAPEIARLSSELGYPGNEAVFTARLESLLNRPYHHVVVAQIEPTTLLGWVAAERRLILESGEIVEITGLIVDPNSRRAGVGHALVGVIEQWAAAQCVASLWVGSNMIRAESHPFYEKLGFVFTKTQHVYAKVL
ncbi:MAG TPA: GNAT family N-acetyltransferase [Thiobacillus sp.]